MDIPIKIQIEDKKKFGDVCFLLDSDDFSCQVELIRRQLGLKERFHGSISEWKQRNSSDEQARKLNELLYKLDIDDKGALIKEALTKELEFVFPSDGQLERVAMDGVLQMGLWLEIEKLHDLFAFPDLLNQAVFASMLCDTVTDEDYVLAKLDFIDTASNPMASKKKRRPYFAIEITPWTRPIDVEEAFKERDKFKLDYCAFYGQFNFHLDKDSISNIRRDREWYWRNKRGESYLDIAKSEVGQDEIDLENIKGSIAKAIGQYKHRLIKLNKRML